MLHLHLTDYQSETRWRWALYDARQSFLADHNVALDAHDPQYQAFLDVPRALHYHVPQIWNDPPAAYLVRRKAWLHELGEWVGAKIFGDLRPKLLEHFQSPATVVQVALPPTAQGLLQRPFELAHIDGQALATLGLRLVYMLEGQKPSVAPRASGTALRVLGIFSLPDGTIPLSLREERYRLKTRLETLRQTKGVAIDIQTVQYGATKAQLKKLLNDGRGWDIIHFSGHGLAGELLLEKEDGTQDHLTADEFLQALRAMPAPPQLVALSACHSGAPSLSALRAEHARLRGEAPPAPDREASTTPEDEVTTTTPPLGTTALPSLAQQVAQQRGCAVLAMRYAVDDEFAIEFLLGLFGYLLDATRTLPHALQLALEDALAHVPNAPEISAITPMLFGPPAATLQLTPPKEVPNFDLVPTGLALAFPPEPERFVGRLLPMLRATQALAPQSGQLGVVFYGMAGAGKTACALELAYRHESERFMGYVWYQAPDQDQTIDRAFYDFLYKMEAQLSERDQVLTAYADQPDEFKRRTAPRLKDLLQRRAILVVIDNAESLLTPSRGWRDSKWQMLIEEVLLAHHGHSRLVLTSRYLPVSLENHPRLRREAVHALSLPESVLHSRQLSALRRLADTPATRTLWFGALEAAQGHPKLLELADKMAENPRKLQERLGTGNEGTPEHFGAQFFRRGETDFTEEKFIDTLAQWTQAIVASLPPTAKLLLYFLARLEEEDLQSPIIEKTWSHFVERLRDPEDKDTDAQEREGGLAALAKALEVLTTSSLLDARLISSLQSNRLAQSFQLPITVYHLHPAIAEIVRSFASIATLTAADWALGEYWIVIYALGVKNELQGMGHWVLEGGRRAAPYLLRAKRWAEAGTLLDDVVRRDTSPSTLAFALPILHQIAEATNTLEDAGILANALLIAKHYTKAEQRERERIVRCVAEGNYRLALVATSRVVDILQAQGRTKEATPLIEQMSDYTQRAGLGPRSQLLNKVYRLKLLNALGHYDEVLAEVEHIRQQLNGLPEKSSLPEAAGKAWDIYERLLDAGGFAAMQAKQWSSALAFNAERLRSQQVRNADMLEIARTRFNDYGPLLKLGLYIEARALLEDCRVIFEQAHDLSLLGKVFSALADLEYAEGHLDQAANFERAALSHLYQVGEPEECAIGHHNLANYFQLLDQNTMQILANLIAEAIICYQLDSTGLQSSISRLQSFISNSSLQRPPFASVVHTVEQVPGVHFAALFAQLPQRAKSGDEAIAIVWEMAKGMSNNTAAQTAPPQNNP